MAALVSHAMRRFSPTPSDPYNLRSKEEGESALSRSMRYADPWLYGSVRSPLLLAPTLLLCSCHDYIAGTKRSKSKSPATCKKCKGARLPLHEPRFGTVRCHAAAPALAAPRAGTLRATPTAARPSILPAADPYDLMRRSRLDSQFRARSSSPHAAAAAAGRRSILECDINPYELMGGEEASITLVNGQRIRVRAAHADEYEEVAVAGRGAKREKRREAKGEKFKSILKKRSTFSDTESEGEVGGKGGTQFYLPLPGGVRKKVQFLVETHNLKEAEEEEIVKDAEIKEIVADERKVVTLKRSASDCKNHEEQKVIFYDTMALRSRSARSDARITFGDLQRLDGLCKGKGTKLRPTRPPPPPPVEASTPAKETKNVEKVSPKKNPNHKIKFEAKRLVNAEKKKMQDESVKKMPQEEVQKIEDDQQQNEEKLVKKLVVEEVQEPPSAPPRKRSTNKPSPILVLEQVLTPVTNKIIVQINPSPNVHKLQIRNQFDDTSNVQNVSITESPQRKTSIMITGDDCYSTVAVNDDIPLYQSSVVVKDTPDLNLACSKKSSSVYITGNFQTIEPVPEPVLEPISEPIVEPSERTPSKRRAEEKKTTAEELLEDLLKNPVEAVKRNLVPHVCGKSDVVRTRGKKFSPIEESLVEEPASFEESFVNLRNYEAVCDDLSSEHSSSTQYELMDNCSECYTDHSNRSSVTEEELANRTKFYELLADSAIVEVADDHHYESIKLNPDPIYEEIEIPPPLPSNPPPSMLLDDLNLDKEYTTRSIFEGASKYDILSYLVDAKERGIVQEDFYFDTKEPYRAPSDTSEDNSLNLSQIADDKSFKTAEVERNDSGVGSETSKSSLSKYRTKPEPSNQCEDCDAVIETASDSEPLICRKCAKKRTERKEIITEIVETEEKYGRDLQIVLEEFYQPMLVAGLLQPDQLSAIFLNVEELLENSQSLAERLRESVEIATEQGDEDLLTVNIGKTFLEAAPMLHGFETYCIRQGAASLLLAGLEKEKELLRIFLRVSQMENTMLRRMNLNSFLMVPVQRVTKYPLLLARLYKVTPAHYDHREQLKEAQHKIELHLNHMNSETKDVPSKLWRRIGSSSGRRSSAEMDLVNIKLRKIAVDVLEWNHDEAKFALEGKLLFTQPTDNNWRKGRTIKLTPVNALLVINGKFNGERNSQGLIFSRHGAIRDAALLLVRDKNGRYSLLREPLYLDRCVIAADPAWQSYFEVQELLGKDTFIFKAEDEEQTKTWYSQLQIHAQGMGAWRRRRNALANIMINGMGLRS